MTNTSKFDLSQCLSVTMVDYLQLTKGIIVHGTLLDVGILTCTQFRFQPFFMHSAASSEDAVSDGHKLILYIILLSVLLAVVTLILVIIITVFLCVQVKGKMKFGEDTIKASKTLSPQLYIIFVIMYSITCTKHFNVVECTQCMLNSRSASGKIS